MRPHETASYKGNLIIPDSAKEVIPTTGIILALGFDLEDGNPYREKDAIIYSKYAGVELTFDDGTKVMIVHEDDILGILDSAPQIKEPAPA